MSHFEMGRGGAVCVCMLNCSEPTEIPHGDKDGVRPEECVKLDQEKSTQRARILNVNWTPAPLLPSQNKNIFEL